MFYITKDKIILEQIRKKISRKDIGAVVIFEGIVRNINEGKKVKAITYEAYQELCNNEGKIILNEAKEKYSLIDALCIHRFGELIVGDVAVIVMTSSMHRSQSYLANQYIIDNAKKRLPIWKKEHFC